MYMGARETATLGRAAELVRVVSRRVCLRRSGQNSWRGLCPFHNDRKTPSFAVFKGRNGDGRYYCFSCGAKGGLVSWLRLMEGKTYREAIGERDDPEIRAALEGTRRYEARRERVLSRYQDRHPDGVIPLWAIRTD